MSGFTGQLPGGFDNAPDPALQAKRAGTLGDFVDRLVDRLDEMITDLYLAGEDLSAARYLYYATRWWSELTDSDLRRAKNSLDGFAKSTHEATRDPASWESTCLIAQRLALSHGDEGVEAAAAALLNFDLYVLQAERRLRDQAAQPRRT